MLEIKVNNKGTYTVSKEDEQWMLNGKPASFDVQNQPNGLISILYNGKSYTALVEKVDRKAKELSLRIKGQSHTLSIKEPIDQLLASMGLDMAAMKTSHGSPTIRFWWKHPLSRYSAGIL